MHDIKFRGKDIITGEWRYGYYVKNVYRIDGVVIERHEIINDGIRYEVIPETVGQYTGMDEVYCGDVVQVLIDPTEFNTKHFWITKSLMKLAYVYYDDDSMCYELHFIEKHRGMSPVYERMRLCDCDYTVIGNIHDSPELLTT